ncbi:MAG: hypothetical protein E7244_27875 [Enterocloster citroniae]|jgi:hypothetical protein|nr:hypothetical protein [Enterocloster citroniae]
MNKTIKRFLATALAATMVVGSAMTSRAAQWQQNTTGWWYQEDNGSYPVNTWKWIDGKCYYFDANGYMLANTTTPDGYQVDASGAWVVNGVVQTQNIGTAGHSANYDPAHPLAGKINEWNLKLPNPYIGGFVIVNDNVQALLTGQMDQYYIPPAGYSINPITGTQMYVEQEDYDKNVHNTQALYQWFCTWLNGMDFENMSEMDKAKEIQKVLAQGTYETGMGESVRFRNSEYSVLIDKRGVCSEYAMTATSLAKALGLKTSVSGTGDHSVYYIQVDGVGYFGQNNVLNLDSPTPDYVYFQ